MVDRSVVRTCLWFIGQALPAAEFYCGLLPESGVEHVERYPEGHETGTPRAVASVQFRLGRAPYLAINGGPHFTFNEAASIFVSTEDQAETDRLWKALTTDGGTESQCEWLKDRYGLSWQIVPQRAQQLIYGPLAAQVWKALMGMKKIDIAGLESAAARR